VRKGIRVSADIVFLDSSMLRVPSLKSQYQNASVAGKTQSQINQSRKRIPIRNQEKIRIHPNANVLLLLSGCLSLRPICL
jgi:hypothetical protein